MISRTLGFSQAFFIFLIISLVCLLMATSYYKLSILVAPSLLLSVLFVFKRQKINLFLYIIIFLIPFGEYRKVGGVNLPWVLALLVLLLAVLDIVMGKIKLSNFKAKIWYFLLPMLLVNFIATVLSPFQETAIDAMKNWVAAYFFIALMLLLINEQGVFKYLPRWIIVSVSLGSFLAVMAIYFGIWTESFSKEGRGTGGAPDPNNMCLMIIFALPMVAHYFIYAKTKPIKFMMLFLLLINLMGIFSTNSRSGMLVALFVLAIMLIVRYRGIKAKSLKIIVPILLSGVLVFPFAVPQKALDRLMTLTAVHKDISVERRRSYLDVGLRAYFERPVIGYGPFTFQHLFAASREARKYQRNESSLLRQAHNTYLEILVGSGTLGILLFLGLLIQAHLNFFKAKRLLLSINMIEYRDLLNSFQISFIGLSIYLLVFSDPYHKDLLIMLPLSELALRYAQNFVLTTKKAYLEDKQNTVSDENNKDIIRC